MNRDLGLVEHYRQFFKMVMAETAKEKQLAYQLRYEVYHKDCGIIDGLNNSLADKIEMDEYDDISSHLLFFHKQTNRAIGYIRLISIPKDSDRFLPIEKIYNGGLDFAQSSLDKIGNGNKCEISRMALVSSFRRRKSDLEMTGSSEQATIAELRRYPINYLPICLIFAVMHAMRKVNTSHAFALVEKRVAIFLGQFGVQYDPIGKPIEFFGKRYPFVLHLEQTCNHLTPEFRNLFDLIGEELEQP